MNVTFKFKGGREKSMPERMARTLQRIGRGTYLTRDMAPYPGHIPPRPIPDPSVVATEPAAASTPVFEDLDAMNAESLHVLAKERGVKVHHKAGADKVRAALREAAK